VGKSASTPAPVNYEKIIPLQTAANKDVFDYSLGQARVNSSTPFGTTTWSQTPVTDQKGYEAALQAWKSNPKTMQEWVPGTSGGLVPSGDNQIETPGTPGYWKTSSNPIGAAPKLDDFISKQWTQTQTLSPGQQKLYDADLKSKLGLSSLTDALLGNVSKATSSALPSAAGYNQQLADAIYRQQTRYLDPQQGDQQRMLETRLAEQGFVPGTPAYTQEFARFDRGNDLAYGDARDRAISGGYQQGQTAFENALRLRALPLSELNAVRTGAQPTIPGMGSGQNSVPGLNAVDLLGAEQQRYQQDMNAYNAQTGSNNALLGVLGQIGGALLGNPGFFR
jgi:hypothetical protein